MPEDKELETFMRYCSNAQDAFKKETLAQHWNAKQRLVVEQFMVAFDSLKDRIRKPLYKPLLATKLEFPPGWFGVQIVLKKDQCVFVAHTNPLNFHSQQQLYGSDKGIFFFFHWDELHTALLTDEKENRQLHVMADLISWYCIGTNGVQLPTLQTELPF